MSDKLSSIKGLIEVPPGWQCSTRSQSPEVLPSRQPPECVFLPCRARSCRRQGRAAHAPTWRTATGVTPGNKQIKLVERVNGGGEGGTTIPALRCLAVSHRLLWFGVPALGRGAASGQMRQIKGHAVCSPHGDSLKKKKNILQGTGGHTQPGICL